MSKIKTPLNPSRGATARVKEPLPAPAICHYCGLSVRIAGHSEIYGRNYGDWPWLYVCNGCGAYVGMHPFTDIPLGTLADAATRRARKNCKPAFDALWRNGEMTRSAAYEWLAAQLGIEKEACHFGWFDIETCERARNICLALETA